MKAHHKKWCCITSCYLVMISLQHSACSRIMKTEKLVVSRGLPHLVLSPRHRKCLFSLKTKTKTHTYWCLSFASHAGPKMFRVRYQKGEYWPIKNPPIAEQACDLQTPLQHLLLFPGDSFVFLLSLHFPLYENRCGSTWRGKICVEPQWCHQGQVHFDKLLQWADRPHTDNHALCRRWRCMKWTVQTHKVGLHISHTCNDSDTSHWPVQPQ